MGNMVKIVMPFVIISALLWSICGYLIVVSSFAPAYTIELGDSKELAMAASTEFSNLPFDLMPYWLVSGGIFGIINAIVFFSRPRYEHSAPAPGITRNPVTTAEIHASIRILPIGLIITIISIVFVFPHFQSNLLLMAPDSIRVINGFLFSLPACFFVLPLSTEWITHHLNENDQY